MKMTRAQIKESLKSVPMEQILLGVHSAKQTNLTAKQIRFAEEIARGETKAGPTGRHTTARQAQAIKAGKVKSLQSGRQSGDRSRRSRRLLRHRDMQPPSI
jgi:hypothetical protein